MYDIDKASTCIWTDIKLFKTFVASTYLPMFCNNK